MKNITAFLLAVVLFVGSAAGMHFCFSGKYPDYSLEYGTWINSAKFANGEGLQQLVSTSGAVPVFGSSELRHGQKSKFHSNKLLKDTGIKPVFIGKAGYQSLNHAITLGAIGNSMKDKKAVLVVSMQWLKKGGVKTDAFGSSFSEENFIKLLENENINNETKDYIINRTNDLTKDNDKMNKKIMRDAKLYRSGSSSGNIITDIAGKIRKFIVLEKNHMSLVMQSSSQGFNKKNETKKEKLTVPDWKNYRQKAETNGEKLCTSNPFGMYDSVYKSTYNSIVKNGNINKPSYSADSPELGDLECFLQVCQQENIKPLLIIVPFNGYWYDFLNLDSGQRQKLYNAVIQVAEKYGANYADLSDKEYELYYFEDNSHPALKGLVDLNEKIYEFCTAS